MRVLVADGDKGVRRTIVETLARIDGATVVGAVPDLAGAVRAIAEAVPDVLVMGTSGDARALVDKLRHAETPRIVVVGAGELRASWSAYVDAGAIQFVSHDGGFEELTEVVGAIGRWPRIEQAEALLQLTEGVAHDLALYLDATRATLALAARSPADDQLKREASKAIEQSRRLASALVGYMRGDASEERWIDLGELVRATVLLARRAVLSPVVITVQIDPEVGDVYGVASELEQMVLNLVLTVRAWLPDHGELAIRVTRMTAAAAIELSTSGGDRRVTVTPERAARSGSLGIVRRVLQRHHAAMMLAGTAIRVVIPIRSL